MKHEFGKDLTFWGGGFVFCQVRNIQPNVPSENIAAMYAAIPG